MQRSFEFPHQQPPLSLLRLEKQPEDRFEELDSHCSAEPALRLRELWGTDTKAEFKAGLQLFNIWQKLSNVERKVALIVTNLEIPSPSRKRSMRRRSVSVGSRTASNTVDQAFSIWYHHPVQDTGSYLWRMLPHAASSERMCRDE